MRVGDVLAAYGPYLADEWLPIGPLAALLGAAATWALRRGERLGVFSLGALVGAVAGGTALAWTRASVVDDAFVSFRYARNLLDGHGLVYNVGERVEGYTNFLWTLLVAAAMGLTGVEAPFVATAGCLVAFVANLGVAWAIGRRLAGRAHLPAAVLLLAVQHTFVAFGTSGLETGAAALTTQLVLLALLRGRPGAAGLAGALGVLLRPDHLLFYGAGGLVLLRRRDLRGLLAYAAPAVLLVAHTAWRLAYYGDLAPNTWYAKSADLAYWSQGWVYTATFWLSSHLWVVVPMLLAWPFVCRGERSRDAQTYVIPAVLLFSAYVAKVGGDFMVGRFFVALLPLVLLAAEDLVRGLLARSVPLAVGVAGVLFATAGGGSLVPAHQIEWYQADEGTVYPVTSWAPFTVGHGSHRAGVALAELFTARGVTPVIATSGIGMVGYWSRLPLVDLRGLTDATIARMPLARRGHPGHEKWPTLDYLLSRDVAVIRNPWHGKRWEDVTALDLGRDVGKTWYLLRWDAALMADVRAKCPEVRFTDFPAWLDRWLAAPTPARAEEDVAFFDVYYFRGNDDPARRAAVRAKVGDPG